MADTITQTKAEFTRAKDRLVRALETTPDDRINWSPSPTARTPLEVAAHAAVSISGIRSMLQGKPMPFSGTAEMDSAFREKEKTLTSRTEVLALIEENSNKFLAWLDSLTPEQVAADIETPFGAFPMANAITFPADHTRGHVAQIEYIQTIYGDREWH